jgi:ABC-type amino acid transport substrate-binding protein
MRKSNLRFGFSPQRAENPGAPEDFQTKRVMRSLYPIAWAAAASVLFAGCASAPQTSSVAADAGVLRVGVSPNSQPMVFKQGERIVGVEADLAESMGRELGRRVVFVEEKWENLIDALCADRIDIIMSSMSITPGRSYQILFTEPYLTVGQIALTRDSENYSYILSLRTQAKNGVGVKPGTTADFLMRQEFPQLPRKYFSTGEEAAEALRKKKIDLFVSDAPMIWHLAAINEAKGLAVMPVVLRKEELGWGIRRGNTELLAAANAFIKKARDNGELNRTFKKWMPGFQ